MIEFVFKPSRLIAGKRVVSRLFSGRYAVDKGARAVTVRLNTPDREIARKRLRDIVLETQREQEGIIAPKAVRAAAAASLGELVDEYETDLHGRGLDGKHVHDSVTRVRRMLAQTGWARLSDVRADAFVKWRASIACSAKTVKEYQVSACAFLNWLVRTDRLAVNHTTEHAMNDSNTNERLMKFLQADPEKQARIDEILSGTFPAERETSVGPLLLGMGAGAKFLGVSRATLWRIFRSGRLEKLEILPGAFRVRRSDLEAFARGRKVQGDDFQIIAARLRTGRRAVAIQR